MGVESTPTVVTVIPNVASLSLTGNSLRAASATGTDFKRVKMILFPAVRVPASGVATGGGAGPNVVVGLGTPIELPAGTTHVDELMELCQASAIFWMPLGVGTEAIPSNPARKTDLLKVNCSPGPVSPFSWIKLFTIESTQLLRFIFQRLPVSGGMSER